MPQNILLIQSDPTAAKSIQQALIYSDEGPFKVEWVRTRAEGLERLTRLGKQQGNAPNGIAAVLVDLFLPDSEGIETFDRLFGVAPQIPFLVLVTSRGKAIAKLAVQRGAQDYLLKSRLDDYLLPKALRNMIERTVVADALFVESRNGMNIKRNIIRIFFPIKKS